MIRLPEGAFELDDTVDVKWAGERVVGQFEFLFL